MVRRLLPALCLLAVLSLLSRPAPAASPERPEGMEAALAMVGCTQSELLTAIANANASGGGTILFACQNTTISLTQGLGDIYDNVVIDGEGKNIVLEYTTNFSGCATGDNGIGGPPIARLQGSGSVIRGLTIRNFLESIQLMGPGNTIEQMRFEAHDCSDDAVSYINNAAVNNEIVDSHFQGYNDKAIQMSSGGGTIARNVFIDCMQPVRGPDYGGGTFVIVDNEFTTAGNLNECAAITIDGPFVIDFERNVLSCKRGLRLGGTTEILIRDNVIDGNERVGVRVGGNAVASLSGNVITNNGYGLGSLPSGGVVVWENGQADLGGGSLVVGGQTVSSIGNNVLQGNGVADARNLRAGYTFRAEHNCWDGQDAAGIANDLEGTVDVDPFNSTLAEEVCGDGVDNDCNGVIDDGCGCFPGETRPCGTDVGACVPGTETCQADGTFGACEGAVGPSPEACDGTEDDDCDGTVDEGCDCIDGQKRDCGTDVGVCEIGQEGCVLGTWGPCENFVGPTTTSGDEGAAGLCNGLDDNCDGGTDEGCGCVPPATQTCGTDVGECSSGSRDCQPDGTFGACQGEVGPTTEICDGLDNDCDGTTDEGCDCIDGQTRPCGTDLGVCQAGTETCAGGTWGACQGEVGPGTNDPDEGAAGLCNGLDDNCDGGIDEGCGCVPPATEPCGTDVGECVAGNRDCQADGTFGACSGAVGPSAETCDGLDNDCDGTTDEGCDCIDGQTRACGSDLGVCQAGTETCAGGAWGVCAGEVPPATTSPDEGTAGLCNGLDDNCDGAVDEGCGCVPPATQACGTEVGECVAGSRDCLADGTFGVCVGAVGPATEACDGLDNDCDGQIDEGCDCIDGQTRPCGTDLGVCQAGTETCAGGAWGTCDGEVPPATANPDEAAAGLCNGLDDNCDGAVDEGCGCVPPATQACGTDVGECVAGTRDCQADGTFGACAGAVGPVTEICDGLDNDCDGQTDEGCDCLDGQTRACGSDLGICQTGTETCAGGQWGTCAGEVPPATTSPDEGAAGLCNGLDDNCDGAVDEGCGCVPPASEACGTDVGECVAGTRDCQADGTFGACVGAIGPATEACDGLDNDCDGQIDEGCECIDGQTRACGSDLGVCQAGTETCVGGLWGTCDGEVPPATTSPDEGAARLCNGLDDNCDGSVDEGCGCVPPAAEACGTDVGECVAGTRDCQADGTFGACVGAVGPATEACDGLDNNCDGVVDEGCDCIDGQTQACGTDEGVCEAGTQTCRNGRWKNCLGSMGPVTTDPDEAAAGLCNGLDDNCDGQVDEGCACVPPETQACGTDVGECVAGTRTCLANGSFGACEGAVGPTAETCDGLDNDCDGSIDEDCDCVDGQTRACGSDVGVCQAGTETCAGGLWGACTGDTGPATAEPDEAAAGLCNGLDDNCDGAVDEGCGCVPPATQACGTDVGECVAGSRDCQADGTFGTCAGAVGPAAEACDGLDNDCDGQTDEGCDCIDGQSRACGSDLGVCQAGTQTCAGGAWGTCDGEVPPATTSPDEGAAGLCNGLDDNCDGQADEGCSCVPPATQACGTDVGECVAGTRACQADGTFGACEGVVGPGVETCDGLDNDCDGQTDEGCDCVDGQTRVCGSDVGVCQAGTETCAGGMWGACDGGVPPATANPDESAAGLCNGLDDNCDGQADEGCSCVPPATQACGTDVGECVAGTRDCGADGTFGACTGAVGPAAETCDGLDNDCDGVVDEGCSCVNGATRTCGTDQGVCAAGTQICAAGEWGTCDGGVGPTTGEADEGVAGLCNGLDDNCDGAVDEGCGCVPPAAEACGTDVGECVAGTRDCQADGTFGACVGAVGPAAEACDGLDNDCDGVVDEGCDCLDGQARACGTDLGVCQAGTETCAGGAWGACEGEAGPATSNPDEGLASLCNGLDDNCDGDVDEGCGCAPPATQGCGTDVGECVAGTRDCRADGTFGACDGAVGPAAEACDGLDNDCDGVVDEGCSCVDGQTRACGTDQGICEAGTQTCVDGAWGGCDGGVSPATPDPDEGAAGLCNGLDDNCDGAVDEGCGCVPPAAQACGTDVGECVAGTRSCKVDGTFGTCEGAVGPGVEICDTLDNDCDGEVDEGCARECPPGDIDMDGNVDGQDLAMLASAFGSDLLDGTYNPRADLTGDGYVDGLDLGVFAVSFGGQGCSR